MYHTDFIIIQQNSVHKLIWLTLSNNFRLKMSDSPSVETEIPRHLLQSQTLFETNVAD